MTSGITEWRGTDMEDLIPSKRIKGTERKENG